MNKSIVTILLLTSLLMKLCRSNNVRSIRDQFEDNFSKKCKKYRFIEKFNKNNFNTTNSKNSNIKYLIFIYHDDDLRNGGFGDRLGGLITAVILSLRYNRILLIKASNGMHSLFQSYYNYINNKNDKNINIYSWQNASIWSNYKINKKLSNDHIMKCVSNTEEGFTNTKTNQCSMIAKDSRYKIIRFQSNRCYLCKYINNQQYNKKFKLILGINSNNDLFEVAGCILRLVMWPTDELWNQVDKVYREFEYSTIINNSDDNTIVTNTPTLPWTLRNYSLYQIGLHLRCGDKYSYRGLKLYSDDYDRHACVYDRSNQYERSHYLNAGNPVNIGQCARSISRKYNNSMLYITSDNVMASLQMKLTANHTNTLISPQGCHIELDNSKECYIFTTVYWFMLALSNIIVSQTFSEVNAPTSSFSRYAGMYGLQSDHSFRSGKYCSTFYPNNIISKQEQGNWICDY